MNNSFIKLLTVLISLFSIWAHSADFSTKDKRILVDTLKNKIATEYVLVEKIDEITRALSALEQSPAFRQATTEQHIAKLLSQTIRQFDGHFSFQWQDLNVGVSDKNRQLPAREGWFNKLNRKNSGFNKVEVLDGNIGYISFVGFNNVTSRSRRIVESVMSFVEDTDAVIFDLRKNGGGSPEMIQLISSYFFAEKTHLNSFYNRQTGAITEFWTFDKVNGKKRPHTPIYVLTSHDTFSAAEEFSYNLKHLQRGTIIGEATGGGANPVTYFNFGDGFRASIPISKAINPVTKTNWEGIGVQPDVKVDAERAFDAAYKLALADVKNGVSNPHQLKEINDKLTSFVNE
jgi:C-terminal processing protease CtpA/Prc